MIRSALAIFAITVSGASQAQAFDPDRFGIEGGVSTLGFHVAPSYEISERVTLRAPIHFGEYSDKFDIDDNNDVDGKLRTAAISLLADINIAYGLRASAGVSYGGYKVTADITDPVYDGNAYTGEVHTVLEQKNKFAPVVSVGYSYFFGRQKSWGITGEVGARITSLELKSDESGLAAGTDLSQYRADIREANDDLDDYGVIPYVTLGLAYRF